MSVFALHVSRKGTGSIWKKTQEPAALRSYLCRLGQANRRREKEEGERREGRESGTPVHGAVPMIHLPAPAS